MAEQSRDTDGVDNERLVALFKSRAGYAANVTKAYNRLVHYIDNEPKDLAEQGLNYLSDAVDNYKSANLTYCQLLNRLKPDSVPGAEEDADKVQASFDEVQVRFNRMFNVDSIHADDSVSVAASRVSSRASSVSSSTSSARVRATAKRAAMQSKLNTLKVTQELERCKIEAELKLERARMEGELLAISEEERVLVEFESLGHVNSVTNATDNPGDKPTGDILHAGMVVQPQGPCVVRGAEGGSHDMRPGIQDLSPSYIAGSQRSPLISDTVDLQQRFIDAMNLPKTTLRTFDGDPLQYWVFMLAFDNIVDKTTVEPGAKLQRLFEYCRGKAASIIQPCAMMYPLEGYAHARKLLRDRFGNPHRIAEAWVTRVTAGPQVKANDGDSLQCFADDVRCCVETLRAMNMLQEIDSRCRMLKMLERLPFHITGSWRKEAVQHLEQHGRYPDIERFSVFLDRVAREINDPVFGVPHQMTERKGIKGSNFSAQASDSSRENSQYAARSPECYICKGRHLIYACEQFNKMTSEDKLKIVKSNRLCFTCLADTHRARWCKEPRCCHCEGRHHKLLHDVMVTAQATTQVKSYASSLDQSCDKKIALPIVSVSVSANDRVVKTRALLDPGSTRTFCSRQLIKQLNITGDDAEIHLETLSDQKTIEASCVALEIKGRNPKGKTILLHKVLAVGGFPKLESGIVSQAEVSQWDHLFDIVDQQDAGYDSEVLLLIGQDHPEILRPLEIRRGGDQEPYAIRTTLGWTINGPIGSCNVASCISAFIDATDVALDKQVGRFWEIDTNVSHKEIQMSVEDKEVTELWERQACLNGDHYVLPIPFKPSPPELPDNRHVAERRLYCLGRRLKRDPKLLERYKSEIDKLLQKGYAEQVADKGRPGGTWYIPHHCVVNTNKPEKLRVVFDCAAQCNGVSLNVRVLQGPDLTNNLIGVLLRFREHEVAVMADVEAMFHQVQVPVGDRDVLRFLWWNNGDPCQEPLTYRMTSHLFGGVWSPSCAAYAMQKTALDNQDDFDACAVTTVLDNFYVDDCLFSTPDAHRATMIVQQLCLLLAKGGFRLTKWISNSRDVLSSIPKEEMVPSLKSLDLDHGAVLPSERALGVHWDTCSDELGIKVKVRDPICTRRDLLSIMSSTYDPLGLVGPCILVAKKIFQSECRFEKGWDEPLSDENRRSWLQWLHELHVLANFRIDRCVIMTGVSLCEVHHFCDASQDAYGSVCYLRTVTFDGQVRCVLLLAKSRLAPLKTVTIPRLELMAAVLSVQINEVICREMRIHIDDTVFWTDSMIVLQYIRNRSKRLKTFVANRVATIHEGSLPEQWRHVDSSSNPADDASRGLSAVELVSCQRWSKGPDFLWQDKENWPVMPACVPELAPDHGEVKLTVKSHAICTDRTNAIESLFSRYSCWYGLRKGVAWILRFVRWLIQRKPKLDFKGRLTPSELNEAERRIVIHTQKTHFSEEVKLVGAGQLVPRRSPIYRLDPIVGDDGILRVGGRLESAPVDTSAKHPAILPKDTHVGMLIVRDVHEVQSRHSGSEHVLSLVRQQYWIVNGRTIVKRVLRQCVPCRRFKGKPCSQRMADLPADRLCPGQPPFTSVGIDCFGPFYVKRGRSREKRYGCLFTCLAIRAIHLEVLHSLEADSFINALVRFGARRGYPTKVRSDNGTNFVAAEKELRAAAQRWNDNPKVQDLFLRKSIEWEFNPPAASHMGGVWERQIRTVRKVLVFILKDQLLDDERLITAFCEVESVVNGRPLTRVPNDSQDLEPLTPNHLLLLRRGPCPLVNDARKLDEYGRRWRHVQYIADRFWHRWLKEYLCVLQLRQKWLTPQRSLEIGDIVLVVDDSLPRGLWPLGRVIAITVGRDNLVRSVDVKTQSSQLTRPVDKLYLLEAVANQ